jgi:hypothetical protein
MPFTLAHPAAVLPLRGLRWLRTVPLVIGALVPDTSYYLPKSIGRYLVGNHSFIGSYTTCLAAGYALLAAVFVLRRPLTALLSARARALCLGALEPFRRNPREWAFAAPAIVLGVWTHLLWDSFTHPDGWMVLRVAALSAPVSIGPYRGTVCDVLQYLSSALGLAVLAAWYWRLPAPLTAPADPHAARSSVGPVLLLVAAAALLIGSVQALEYFARAHHLYRTLNILLTGSVAWFALLYLVAGVIVTLEHAPERVPERRA